MTPRLISVPALLAVLVAAPAVAQNRGDFHWNGTVAAGSQVTIGNINGNIKVVPSTTGRVDVTGIKLGTGRGVDYIRADVQQTSRGLKICVLYDEGNSTCNDNERGSNNSRGGRDWGNVRIDLEVSVPTTAMVSASSVSGDVTVSGAHGDIDANSVSGDIRLDGLYANSVRGNSVSGNIEVQVTQLIGRGNFSFNTVSGDVILELPRNFDADVSMSTVSGGIDTDFQMTLANSRRIDNHQMEARIGQGGRRLDLNTVSGDVKLRMGSR